VTLLWTLIVPIGIACAVPNERLPASKAAAIESAFIENSISIQPSTPYDRQIELEMNCAFMFAGEKEALPHGWSERSPTAVVATASASEPPRRPQKIVHVLP
jgi:hypothetical protein